MLFLKNYMRGLILIMNRFSKLLQSFLTDYIISECNYSKNTKASYTTSFYLLVKFLNEVKHIKPNDIKIEDIDKDIILEFLNWLQENRNASVQTRNQRLAAIKSFYKYVQINEPDLFDTCSLILSIKNKKAPKKIIAPFSKNEIKIIKDYLNNEKKLKYLTMILILYDTGARVSEFINIKTSDLNLSENASITIYGKGNKIREVPISQELVKLIKLYLDKIYIDYGEEYLFYSNQKKKYHRSSINYIIKNLCEILKEKYPDYFNGNYHPHTIRHSKASHLYDDNTPLLIIKDLLGHEELESTQIYATPSKEREREIILKNAIAIEHNKSYSKAKTDNLDEWLKNNMK